jgi:hypothetical protein
MIRQQGISRRSVRVLFGEQTREVDQLRHQLVRISTGGRLRRLPVSGGTESRR